MRTAPARLTAVLSTFALLATLLVAFTSASPAEAAGDGTYRATIRRTAHGIPHIEGSDFGDIGFGYGYAFASDNICEMADEYVTVNGDRSRFFGPDGTYTVEGNGFSFTNFNSDVYYRAIRQQGVVEELLAQEPPLGPVDGIEDGIAGYVAGYNHYLQEVGGAAGIEDPRCKGAEWVRPIIEMDAYLRFYSLGILASSGIALDGIAAAEPPHPSATGGGSAATTPTPEQLQQLDERLSPAIGSNAYGLGKEATANGRGMVLGNPHFPWHGSERFYQAHLTIPGEVDVHGASLFGVPLVLIGHTRTMGWSHTVSTARRFTIFELKLEPGSPTTYLVDGEPREMTRTEVTVPVQTDSGTEERAGDIYETEYGPVLISVAGLPIFPWEDGTAWALGDVNSRNFRYLNHFFEVNKADSVERLHEILTTYQGIPWVNTIAADSSGTAYYADIGAIPHVTDAKLEECSTGTGQTLWAAARLPVLDGARSACQWGSDDDAVVPGTFGPSNEPHLFRDDYVTNSNDSYWLSNPEEPIEGFAEIIGNERTARTLRTRLGLIQVIERLAGEDGREGERFTLEQLQDVMFGNRQYAGELTRDAAVEMCGSMGGTAPSSSGPTSTEGACEALASWNLRDDLDSNGAILFRRFWTHARGATPSPWVNEFDPEDPVHTPNTLDTDHPEVRQALGDAINDLRDNGIPLDAPLRGFQSEARGDEQLPVHGGPGVLGVFNAINVSWLGEDAYNNVDHGSSFVMTVSFQDDGCADVGTLLTYSQSTDETSPYWADQLRMYGDKEWVDVPFCPEELAAADAEVLTVTNQPGGGQEPDPPPAPEPALPTTGGGAGLLALTVLGLGVLVRRRR
ncbi:MAG: penicillin acylase family protein [Actinobacteria bacterium]|nr:penicillin acylase family protein [Actinomycetota bacterium]